MSSEQESASKWLAKSAKTAWVEYLTATVMIVLSATCFVAFSWYLSTFANAWLVNEQIRGSELIIAAAAIAGRYIFAHFASLLNYKAGNKIAFRIKQQLYPQLLADNSYDSVSATLMTTKASDDLKPFYSFFIPYAMASVTVGGLLLGISLWSDKWVGYALMVTFMVIPLQMVVVGLGAESLHKKHIDLFLKYAAVFYNRLQTIAEIVNLDNFKQQYRFLDRKSTELNKATTNVMSVAILSSAVLELFVTIAIAAVAIYLGMSLLGIMPGENYGKGYDFRKALFLLMLAPYFFFYLRKFVSAYHDRNRAVASAKIIMPVLQVVKNEEFNHKDEPFRLLKIENVSFAYPESPVKVLHNINLHLPQKGLVLVKGISGSGKSTLLKIIAGNLHVMNGKISVNGRDNQWSEQWLKHNTSYMNQFPFVFDGSLYYNVFLKEKEVDTQNFPPFLEKLLVKKENGWDTVLSHNGKQLSGGEKQLVTLARIILYPKPIAIMDEPTANLDAETTGIILEQIKQIAADRLVIVASHEDRFDAIADVTLNLNWGEQED